MAKPKTPNQKRKYGELNKRLAKYVMLVESIYEDLNLEAAKIVGITDFTIDSDRPFMWSDYPQTRKRIRDLQERFVEDIGAVIYIVALLKNGKTATKFKIFLPTKYCKLMAQP